jgi:hypothetical protein
MFLLLCTLLFCTQIFFLENKLAFFLLFAFSEDHMSKRQRKESVESGDQCACGQEHKIESFDPNALDEEDEEWDRHTQTYRDEYAEFVDCISDENCQEGERKLKKWVEENHEKLCCKNRHRAPWAD